MKILKLITVFISLAAIVLLNYKNSRQPEAADRINQISEEKYQKYEENKLEKGPELESKYFARWHEPFGNVLETDHLNRIWNEINKVPQEQSLKNAPVNSWGCIGPYGMTVINANARYTGRILDIEVLNSFPQFQFDFRIASASGGIWVLITFPFPGIPGCISNNQITSQATSCLATHPFNTNIIFTGTGESQQRGGTGMWKTTNGGQNWEHVSISPEPGAFYRIKFNPGNPTRMHAVSNLGYYRSDNSGITWTRYFTGNVTDMAIRPDNPNYIFITKNGDNTTGGVYASADGGTTSTKLTSGIASTNVGRSSITLCRSNSNIIYASLGQLDDNSLLGVWKSINNGASWTNVTPGPNIGGNAWYNNVISVSPTNPNIVLVGMTQMARTTNGGSSWTLINDENLHVDHHALTWRNGGDTVYSGNDGGFSRSYDGGATWTNSYNNYGITQFYNFDIGVNNTAVIFGGSQDNGVLGTTSFNGGGANWQHTLGGDGAGVTIDRIDASKIYAVNGAYGGTNLFWRQKSNNYGQSWSTFNSGISTDQNWAPVIRQDRQNPDYLYTNAEQFVYYSASPYSSWNKLNTTAFPYDVSNVTVTNAGVVYACLSTTALNGLVVYDGGTWYPRTSGFPSSVGVRTVAHRTYGLPFFQTYSYALMNGFAAGQKVFRTTNKGVNWTNISGDLPNVPMGDLVPHPTTPTILYLGTEFGCYRTTNGGANWHRWNNGMPESNIVTELNYIDSMSVRNKFYVVAATFGRSFWIREIGGDDPVSINKNTEFPKHYALNQNYPNPFNPLTVISYELPVNSFVLIKIYDAIGRDLETLVNGKINAGLHQIEWNALNYPSGVYYYKLIASEFTETKKMILIK